MGSTRNEKVLILDNILNACELFKCRPSQLENEDVKLTKELIYYKKVLIDARKV